MVDYVDEFADESASKQPQYGMTTKFLPCSNAPNVLQ
jgi:hypothetical protein